MNYLARFKLACGLLVANAMGLVGLGQDSLIQLTDVTDQSNVQFEHTHGGNGMEYIVEGMSTGIVTFDYDADGNVDIYFLNGAALQGTDDDSERRNALYRNNGDWTFTDVTEEAGVGDSGYALGATVADYDGDQDLDIYISNFGANVLYRNNGDKTFTDVTAEAGVGNGNRVGAGVAFFDMDGDEDLDLYAANYVNFDYDKHVPIIIKGMRFQAGPQYYEPVPDSLFRNNGDGTFTDVSQESGVASVSGPGMGLVCADFDEDQDLDVYVCNDGQPNFLFQNDGKGGFEEIGLLAGLAYDFSGKANSSMGVDIGDFDLDGLFDLFVTNYQGEMPVLYRNLGGGLFEDATTTGRVTHELFPHVNWGTAFIDFDNDGDEDIFVACGHFDRVEQIDDRTQKKLKNYLLRNDGGRYVDVTDESGTGFKVIETSRGAAFEDFDNDGDIDAVVLNSSARPTLMRNDTDNLNCWLEVELQQPGKNPFAIGAVIQVVGSGQKRIAVSGRGYQSHYGSRLHIGLGTVAEQMAVVKVTWPDASTETFRAEVNALSRLVRGEGETN